MQSIGVCAGSIARAFENHSGLYVLGGAISTRPMMMRRAPFDWLDARRIFVPSSRMLLQRDLRLQREHLDLILILTSISAPVYLVERALVCSSLQIQMLKHSLMPDSPDRSPSPPPSPDGDGFDKRLDSPDRSPPGGDGFDERPDSPDCLPPGSDGFDERPVSPARPPSPPPGPGGDGFDERPNSPDRPPSPPPGPGSDGFDNPPDPPLHPLIHLDLDELAQRSAHMPKHARSMSFIQHIRNASLDDRTGLTGDTLDRLCNPPKEVLKLNGPCDKLAIEIFMALEHSSEASYDKIRSSIQTCFPDSQLPSFYQVKRLLADLTGVTSVIDHMCINSCVAFVGPFSELDACPECDEPRFNEHHQTHTNKRIPCVVFHMIPIGPQLQALWRHPESAEKMRYRMKKTQEVFD